MGAYCLELSISADSQAARQLTTTLLLSFAPGGGAAAAVQMARPFAPPPPGPFGSASPPRATERRGGTDIFSSSGCVGGAPQSRRRTRPDKTSGQDGEGSRCCAGKAGAIQPFSGARAPRRVQSQRDRHVSHCLKARGDRGADAYESFSSCRCKSCEDLPPHCAAAGRSQARVDPDFDITIISKHRHQTISTLVGDRR